MTTALSIIFIILIVSITCFYYYIINFIINSFSVIIYITLINALHPIILQYHSLITSQTLPKLQPIANPSCIVSFQAFSSESIPLLPVQALLILADDWLMVNPNTDPELLKPSTSIILLLLTVAY